MTIKHLVLCGGGPVGLSTYGALKYLNQHKFWELSNIESIYTCSIGSTIGVIISLDLEWKWIDDFFIKRPWMKIFNFDNINYLNFFKEKGILDESFWKKVFQPLFLAKSIDLDITLLEFYNLTNIEINFATTYINDLEKQNINYISHPRLKLITAIYISSCIPFLFKPYFEGSKCYMDGGLLNNIPINDCIIKNNCDYNEILNFTNETNANYLYYQNDINYYDCINNNSKIDKESIDFTNNNSGKEEIINTDSNTTNQYNTDLNNNPIYDLSNNLTLFNKDISSDSNVLDFTAIILNKILNKFIELNTMNNINIKNTVNVKLNDSCLDINIWLKILQDKYSIENVINFGIVKAKKFFIEYLQDNTEKKTVENEKVENEEVENEEVEDEKVENQEVEDEKDENEEVEDEEVEVTKEGIKTNI